ncbi:MAG: GNAT family N-acetyltransferase [Desulfitobacteriaceae bacterium]|nr:GNAT family N-acetyltransferase [Desulfitobacteriaceae bacterium]MDI6914045.1 GNAT family N-acetyltransferase [Desulfitobacteriaceae bacterium]
MLKVLALRDKRALQTLLEKCDDYLSLQNGGPIGPNAAEELLMVRPEDASERQKLVLGIYQGDTGPLVGVCDLLKGYIGPDVLSLGLLLLEPAARRRGLGQLAYQDVEEWARNEGFTKIRIGVLMSNELGLKFWHKVGFKETGEIKAYRRHWLRILEKGIKAL